MDDDDGKDRGSSRPLGELIGELKREMGMQHDLDVSAAINLALERLNLSPRDDQSLRQRAQRCLSAIEDSRNTSVAGVEGNAGTSAAAEVPQDTRSIDSDRRVRVEFFNTLSEPIEAMWVDFNGNEVSYGVIHESWRVDTFATHPWRFYTLRNRRLVFQIVADASMPPRVDVVEEAVTTSQGLELRVGDELELLWDQPNGDLNFSQNWSDDHACLTADRTGSLFLRANYHWPVRVTEVDTSGGRAKVEFEAYEGSWDAWVDVNKLRTRQSPSPDAPSRASHGDAVEVKLRQKTAYCWVRGRIDDILYAGVSCRVKIHEPSGGFDTVVVAPTKLRLLPDGEAASFTPLGGSPPAEAQQDDVGGHGLAVGDRVKVSWGQTRYNAVVIDVDCTDAMERQGLVWIHYPGWSETMDELVPRSQVARASDGGYEYKWRGGRAYRCEICELTPEVIASTFKVRWEGWGDSWDQWVVRHTQWDRVVD